VGVFGSSWWGAPYIYREPAGTTDTRGPRGSDLGGVEGVFKDHYLLIPINWHRWEMGGELFNGD
jgi:hypothetical protein